MSVGLTGRQAQLYDFIAERIESTRVAPSYDEMVRHLGVNSRGSIARLVDGLVARGHLVRLDRCARGIGLRRPEGQPPANLAEQAARAHADGITVRLPKVVAAHLLTRCHEDGTVPGELIAQAVSEYLRRRP